MDRLIQRELSEAMTSSDTRPPTSDPLILVTGCTGTTGRRIVERRRARHTNARGGSRTAIGRPPREFTGFARRVAAAGAFDFDFDFDFDFAGSISTVTR
jgi:nucleoside-diphosphate-sugar epimerase